MTTIAKPPEYRWVRDDIPFGDSTVELWCPQTQDFESHGPGTLERKGGIDKEELEKFTAFKNWKENMLYNLKWQDISEFHPYHKRPYSLKSLHINAVTRFPNGNVGFVKMDAWIQREPDQPREQISESTNEAVDYNNTLFETVFLRGGSVAILMILRPIDQLQEQWVILTEQPRVPACSLRFLEIPAGMMDNQQNFGGAAAKEIKEETGLTIPESELINMTELALRQDESSDNAHPEDSEKLAPAMYPSPGGCDEYISLFVWETNMERTHIENLRGRFTGLRHSGEKIQLRLEKYTDLWKVGARDAKTLGALGFV